MTDQTNSRGSGNHPFAPDMKNWSPRRPLDPMSTEQGHTYLIVALVGLVGFVLIVGAHVACDFMGSVC